MIFLQSSLTLSLLKRIIRGYNGLEISLGRLYQTSRTGGVFAYLWRGARINFRGSFLGRLTDIDRGANPAILENSVFIKRILSACGAIREKTTAYSKNSAAVNSVNLIRRDFYQSPLSSAGLVISAAIAVNIVLSALLKKEISALGWILRAALFFTAAAGLFNKAKWQDIEKSSLFLKYLKKGL